jgi:hypothetical protein
VIVDVGNGLAAQDPVIAADPAPQAWAILRPFYGQILTGC